MYPRDTPTTLFIIIWAVLLLGTKLEAVLVKFGSEKIETFTFIYLHQAHSLFNNSTENPYDTFNLRTYPSEEKRIIEIFGRNICSADLTKELDCSKIFVHIFSQIKSEAFRSEVSAN